MRRTRYTVTLEGRDPFVIIAADEGQIYNHYGSKLVGLRKGDFRKVAKPRVSGPGFRVDQQALKQAIALLGLKVKVKVRFHARNGSTLGNYRFAGTHHNIMLKSYLTPEQASHTLWHELTHAMQAERAGSKEGWSAEHRRQRRYSYQFRPIEVEANKMADKMSHHLLCR